MGVWEVFPGYLSDQQLEEQLQVLGRLAAEPEVPGADLTLKHWRGYEPALAWLEAWGVAELRLRGSDRPLTPVTRQMVWPPAFEIPPANQFARLRSQHQAGRIAVPKTPQQLWAQHKYSVMARDPARYRALGRRVALGKDGDFAPLAEELLLILRELPQPGRLFNALEHLWGYVANQAGEAERRAARHSAAALLENTAALAVRLQVPYLLSSTALTDLAIFVAREGAQA